MLNLRAKVHLLLEPMNHKPNSFDFEDADPEVVVFISAALFLFGRFSTVLVSTSASILRPSKSGWLLSTWHFFVSWETRQKLVTTATASRLGEMDERLSGRATLGALGIAIGRSETATMASLYRATWPSSSLEGKGKISSCELQGGYGKNSKTRKVVPAYHSALSLFVSLTRFHMCPKQFIKWFWTLQEYLCYM